MNKMPLQNKTRTPAISSSIAVIVPIDYLGYILVVLISRYARFSQRFIKLPNKGNTADSLRSG
jgi:hypothetical protein